MTATTPIKPVTLRTEEITDGQTWEPIYTIAMGGVALDLSPAQIGVQLRLRKQGSSSGQIAKTKGVVNETSFPGGTGADGRIRFLFSAAEITALTNGSTYDVELWVSDSASPGKKTLFAYGLLVKRAAATGTTSPALP